MNKILFVCTGNYYRSRFAEIYFNHLAAQSQLPVKAYSRGLEVFKCHNIGPISEYTRTYLTQLDIPLGTFDYPVQLLEADFRQSIQTIILDEAEHRPMIQQYFPEWEDKVTYWKFRDIQFDVPEQVLPALDKHVKTFVQTFL
jgi:protein-tyrosine phosphatase